MIEKIKMTLAAILVLLLLPYFFTKFFDGQLQKDYAIQTLTEDFISVRQGREVREIALEDYVMGVTARQIDGDSEIEAVKAQMIIVRTNLKKQLEDNPGELPEEDYMTLAQLRSEGIADRMAEAVEVTRGQVLTYDGKLVAVPYHAISAGMTRSGSVMNSGDQYQWLKAVDSPADAQAERFLRVEMLAKDLLKRRLETEYPGVWSSGEVIDQIEILRRDDSGYILLMQVGNEKISGEKFRDLLDLNSSCFDLEEIEGKIRITTKGLGHGLGLSQYGARQLAGAGKKYAEILQYYFPECIIA